MFQGGVPEASAPSVSQLTDLIASCPLYAHVRAHTHTYVFLFSTLREKVKVIVKITKAIPLVSLGCLALVAVFKEIHTTRS